MATSRPVPTERASATETLTKLPPTSFATTKGTNSPAENGWPTEKGPDAGTATVEWAPSPQVTSTVYGGSPPVTVPSRTATFPGAIGFGPTSTPDNERGTTIEMFVRFDRPTTVSFPLQSSTAPDRTDTGTIPEPNDSAVNVADGPMLAFRNPVALPLSTDQRYQSAVTRQRGVPADQTAWTVRLEPVRIS